MDASHFAPCKTLLPSPWFPQVPFALHFQGVNLPSTKSLDPNLPYRILAESSNMDAEPVVKIQFLVEEELLDLEAAHNSWMRSSLCNLIDAAGSSVTA